MLARFRWWLVKRIAPNRTYLIWLKGEAPPAESGLHWQKV